MAASLDGYVAPAPGKHWLTGERAIDFVRELRTAHDAVMVGAGTVRVDDPLLTIRPPRTRVRPYIRVVACEDAPVPSESRIFTRPDPVREGVYERTIVLAPAGSRERFAHLEDVAEVLYVGDARASTLDLHEALIALKQRGIGSVLSEGGPTLASRLLRWKLVDRLHWLIAPKMLAGQNAVSALAHLPDVSLAREMTMDVVKRLGDDVLFSARFKDTM
jgi:diaminohydroxyphosphoribosylaminopyrimidine deaminase/5-amino-6-(5-phosphoribosylamino)uracil reductase